MSTRTIKLEPNRAEPEQMSWTIREIPRTLTADEAAYAAAVHEELSEMISNKAAAHAHAWAALVSEVALVEPPEQRDRIFAMFATFEKTAKENVADLGNLGVRLQKLTEAATLIAKGKRTAA